MKVKDIMAAINEHAISMQGRFPRGYNDPVYFIYKSEKEPSLGEHDFFGISNYSPETNSTNINELFYKGFSSQYQGMALLFMNILNRAARSLYAECKDRDHAIADIMTFDFDIMDVMEEYAKIFHGRFLDRVDGNMAEVYVLKFSENAINPGHLIIRQLRYLGNLMVASDTTMHYCIDQAGEIVYQALHPKYIFANKDNALYMADLFEKLYINRRGEYNNNGY